MRVGESLQVCPHIVNGLPDPGERNRRRQIVAKAVDHREQLRGVPRFERRQLSPVTDRMGEHDGRTSWTGRMWRRP
jgi:hypothetical protein